jgi:ribonuclease P protein component
MIARAARFHGYGSLRRVYQSGQTIRGNQVSIRCLKRTDTRQGRVAVVVSKKVSKSAVVRNRIRRRVYETVRLSSVVPPHVDIVITVFSDQFAEMPITNLANQLEVMLQKTDQPPQKTA